MATLCAELKNSLSALSPSTRRVHASAVLLLFLLLLFPPLLPAEQHPSNQETPAPGSLENCILKLSLTAPDEMSIGEIRRRCHALDEAPDQVEKRFRRERLNEREAFVITPHKPNYILLGAYNFKDINRAPFPPAESKGFKQEETKFQLSFKIPIVTDILGSKTDLYAAYTNRSFWQLYAWDFSAPFRETNHEPEAWFRVGTSSSVLGLRLDSINLGAVHQSNGRGGDLSRSWNRLYAQAVFSRRHFGFGLKSWITVGDLSDNPDISRYMGHFEFQGAYKAGQHTLALMLRNNLDFSQNRGAAQLGWSFPLFGRFRGYAQWFYGYGESLIDYQAKVNSLGLGIQLTDWF